MHCAVRTLLYLELSPVNPQIRVQTHLRMAAVLTESTDESEQVSPILHPRQNTLERAQSAPAQKHREEVITAVAPLCRPEVKIS